jgi:hypothetical protein
MYFLAMYALLLRIRYSDMCLPVCYLAMDALLLLDTRLLEHIYIFVSKKRPNLSQYNSVMDYCERGLNLRVP